MTQGGLRLVTAVLVAMAFGAGCGDGEDVQIDIRATKTPDVFRTTTPGAPTIQRTSTPGVARTASPSPTVTPAGATPTGATATPTTAGGPTASPSPGGVSQSVETTVGDLLPFLTVAGLTTGVGTSVSAQQALQAPGAESAAVGPAKVDNCPNGGTRTQDEVPPTVTVTLTACKFTDAELGSFQFDGTIAANLLTGTAAFNVTTQDLLNSRTVTFVGSVSGTPSGGGFVVNGGPIVITTPQGEFTLTLANLTVDSDGDVVSGGGTMTDDDDVFDLQKIQLTIRTGGLLADLVATFDDDSTASFVIDLKKGEITPA